MILIGLALALFFLVGYIGTGLLFVPPTWLVHVVYILMILLALGGGCIAARKQ